MIKDILFYIENELKVNDAIYLEEEKKIKLDKSSSFDALYDDLVVAEIWEENEKLIAYLTDFSSFQRDFEIESVEKMKELLKSYVEMQKLNQTIHNILWN